jgi:hypothetical protein
VRQYYIAALDPLHRVDGAAYNTSVTLTDVSPAPSIVIPANAFVESQRFEWVAICRFSNTGTPTLNLGLYYGAGTIASTMAVCTTGAVTTTTAASNQTVYMRGNGSVRAVGSGANGQLFGAGTVEGLDGTAFVNTRIMPPTAPAVLTCDTTLANKMMIGATWGTSSASNTLTCHFFEFRIVD